MKPPIDKFGCLDNMIKVSAGHYVCLKNPDPATIDLESIAAALSKLCRYGGYCPRFYSVAEHSIHVLALASSEGFGGDALKAMLLHDAAEAYLGDVVKPLKIMLPEYEDLELRMERAIEAAFGFEFEPFREAIKRFDRRVLKAEKVAMWPDDGIIWPGFEFIKTPDLELRYLSPKLARAAFRKAAGAVL